MNIFTLMGTIMIDTDKANDSISKTDEKAKGLAGKLGDGIKTAGKWAVGIGAAAGVVGGAMLGVASKAADAAGEIDDMAQRTGTTAEEFQKYAYAAKLSGMETATLEKAMIKSQTAFADAKNGSKAMSEAYQALGIDINNIGSSSEAFDEVIMRLADMEDETQRNALANDIFGKSYAELAPLLNSGSDGIKKLKQEAVDLGGVMSNEAVAAGADFGDMLDKSKTMLAGVTNNIGIMLLPILMQLLTWITDHMPEIQATVSTVFSVIGTVVSAGGEIFAAIIPILETLYNFIKPTFPVIAEIIKISFGLISDSVEGVVWIFDKVTGAIKTALEWLGLWNKEPVEDKDPKPVNTPSNRRVNRAELDGSHAAGLAYVPYNGYVAELHEGERVLTAEENRKNSTTKNNYNIVINNPKPERSEDSIRRTLLKYSYGI